MDTKTKIVLLLNLIFVAVLLSWPLITAPKFEVSLGEDTVPLGGSLNLRISFPRDPSSVRLLVVDLERNRTVEARELQPSKELSASLKIDEGRYAIGHYALRVVATIDGEMVEEESFFNVFGAPELNLTLSVEKPELKAFVNVTAEGDSEFAGMAWTLQIPISRFAGERIYVVLTNGSWVEVKLREEHVPGNFSLLSLNEVACWVIPMDNDSGLVYSVLTDLWPQGISISIDDEREWGGNTYALRNWISQYFSLYKGQLIRVLVYLRAYTGDPGPAVDRVLTYTERVAMGESLSTLKRAIIEELNLEEARAARSNPVTTYMLVAFFAFTALLALLILYYFLRTRGWRQAI